jgi:hypothetical protein
MLEIHEARLAVECAAICEWRGVVYRAHSLVYTKTPRGRTTWSIVLQDRNSNSVMQASLVEVKLLRWNLPDDIVENLLKNYKENGGST